MFKQANVIHTLKLQICTKEHIHADFHQNNNIKIFRNNNCFYQKTKMALMQFLTYVCVNFFLHIDCKKLPLEV